jgi:virulence-associated protein VagC
MAQRATANNKAQVIRSGRSQSVRLPSAFRLKSDQVYIRRDEQSGIIQLSEKPFRPSMQEVYSMFDALDLSDFEIERDRSLPRDIDL